MSNGTVKRISMVLSNIVEEAAITSLSNMDDFDFEVGIAPMAQIDEEDGEVYYEMSAWAIMRLACPETESKSVLSISTPLQMLTEDAFRSAVNKAMTEMQFSRIAAAYDEDEYELMLEPEEVVLYDYESEDDEE